jgi:ketosteroid isomerase-like protein
MSEQLRDARAVVEHALALLLAHDMTSFSSLWAEDGIIEYPFAASGYPDVVSGQAAVEKHLRGYPDVIDIRATPVVVIHETTDPEVVIVEFEATGLIVHNQYPYRMPYIAVITVRDGRILRYRDYWSPLKAQEAMGAEHSVPADFVSEA